MRGLSVIIPSRDFRNLGECVEAVRKFDRKANVIVIWDAPATGDPGVSDLWQVQNLLDAGGEGGSSGIVLRGKQPFVFARNCNIGINVSDDDVILLNDDAILESRGGFTAMQRAAQEHPEYGIISATTNNAGNPMQFRRQHPEHMPLRACPSPTPGNSFAIVAFVCVLIPRRTIEAVGTLDERFTAYGWEDNDYCRRVGIAGLKIGIYDGCFVDHAKLKSTFRGQAFAAGDINAGRKIYMEKWGSM